MKFLIHNADTVEPHEFDGTKEEANNWIGLLRREGYVMAWAEEQM